jgi:hypothetical protein
MAGDCRKIVHQSLSPWKRSVVSYTSYQLKEINKERVPSTQLGSK